MILPTRASLPFKPYVDDDDVDGFKSWVFLVVRRLILVWGIAFVVCVSFVVFIAKCKTFWLFTDVISGKLTLSVSLM